ncbi:MAG: hypothetical protein KAJ53_07060 [Anaerolineales bacterium]|nr:hypothetical protein [Anaerolineales bacterium]
MDAIREQANKPLIIGILGLVLGIILGVLYGWVINPVEWTDASIEHLRLDLQEEYMRMAVDSYQVNQDAALAVQRYEDVGENAEAILVGIAANPGNQSTESIIAFQAAVQVEPVGAITETPVAGEAPAEGSSIWRILLPILCLGIILAAGAAFYFLYWRYRESSVVGPAPVETAAPMQPAERVTYEPTGEEPPMVQFMASYKLGDDLFDDSFSIDSPSGEFLGECGVGLSETVGVGDPKKVSAFEVWLFDKNDIQTVTKVLMSAHAFLDDTTRGRLAAKGEPILAEPGTESVLETQTLRLVARVVDMGYGEGALPDHSFFDRLILELAVWPKS